MDRTDTLPNGRLPANGSAAPASRSRRVAFVAAMLLVVIGAGLSLLPGCGGEDREWNVLLLTLDTTRADRLGCYGRESARTPVLDGLAEGGILYENAAAQAPLTLPTHASLLTGFYPPHHGARGNGAYHLPQDRVSLAEVLQQAGYQTSAVIAAFVLDRRFGLAQGFDTYDDDAGDMQAPTPHADPTRSAEAVTRAALDAANRLSLDRPYFLWVHYFDPHAPYVPPARHRAAFPGDLSGRYDAEIAAMDEAIGRLLDGLRSRGLLDRTLIVAVGDHGEGFPGPHDEETHGIYVYEDTLRIPLIVHAEGAIRGPRRSKELVRQIDIFPTVLDFVGIEGAGPTQGRSFRPTFDGEPLGEEVVSYAESTGPWDTQGWSPLFQVRDREWKYVAAPKPELYRLADDPEESRNVIDRFPEVAKRYRQILERIRADAPGGEAPMRAVSAEERDRLRQLGYVNVDGAAGPIPTELAELADPKELIHLTHDLERARKALDEGRTDEGIEKLRAILAEDPGNIEAHRVLALHRMETGELDEAAHHFQAILASRPRFAAITGLLGDVRFRQKRFAEAGTLYAEAAEIDPREPANWGRLGNLNFETGNAKQAEQYYLKGLEIAPEHGQIHFAYATFLADQGRDAEAIVALEKVVVAADVSPEQRLNANLMLVTALLNTNDLERAARWIEHLLREHPRHPRAPEWRAGLDRIRAASAASGSAPPGGGDGNR